MTEGAALLEDVEILGRRSLWGPAPWGALSTRYQAVGAAAGTVVVQAQNAFSLPVFSGVWLVEWGTGSSTLPQAGQSPQKL